MHRDLAVAFLGPGVNQAEPCASYPSKQCRPTDGRFFIGLVGSAGLTVNLSSINSSYKRRLMTKDSFL